MTRHLADQPRTRGTARAREFLKQERAAFMHPAIRSLYASRHPQPAQQTAGAQRRQS
ncbi:hypothetical protein [Paracoccus sp. JM45]|uniref:hypothetical protein n=1 Tax=Paracoccus sp. JM45 TaxID=2283626 RepID=UPI00160056C8|nr:hypothetical protein [Paracoccus sp. JM45]